MIEQPVSDDGLFFLVAIRYLIADLKRKLPLALHHNA